MTRRVQTPRLRETGSEPAWFVSSVEKALQILQSFEARDRSLSLSEIAKLTGLDKSSVQRFTYTLAALGYLKKDQQVRRYAISPKVLSLGMIYLRTDPLVARARFELYELNKHIDATVNLTELDGTDIIYVVRFPGRQVVTVDVVLGMRRPAFCTASGRAILATLPDDQVRSLLEMSDRAAFTEHTKTSVEAIMAEIHRGREQGFVVTEQETTLGDISIAAPVRRTDGGYAAAVNLSVSTADWKAVDVARRFGPTIVNVAQAISGARDLQPLKLAVGSR